jgi:hypothetical protein
LLPEAAPQGDGIIALRLFVRAAANCCLFALVAARRGKDDDVDK